ncbi:AMP-binding protein [Eleftheria terrae]|uniref:AMP-binding protein n=1 Tax=Eleftheria terrae TaxID=1597781 RepID=UPI00263AB447|nr:AMP-binding protein [Eleftheria terrae]WKB53466.1 AMP-binding protein [Eleftheria terrae]
MRFDDLLARLRGRTATTVCFVDEQGAETRKTLQELYCDTQALMERLAAAGLKEGCRIGIAAPSSYRWMVWDLACIGLGCVSVALPHEPLQEPAERLLARYQLTVLALPALLPGEERVLDIDAASPWPRVSPRPQPHAPGTHSLVFSSGTTGKTKGLIISRAGTEKLVTLYADAFGVRDGERCLTFLPFANYQQRMVYYFCLYYGVDFVYLPFPQLFAGLRKQRPTFMIAPPVFYETLQNLALAVRPAAGMTTADRLAELLGGRIRYMITGMAPIKRATLDFFWRHGVLLYEAFGITEAGMVAWNKPGCVRLGTVGKPAEAGTVSLSEDGEVVVSRQALLSMGYFEASEEDLRSTFLSPQSVATGDIAEFDVDGFLHIVGRKKDAIVARNGEKFHPEPIESLLHADPRVTVAVLLGSDEAAGLTAVLGTRQVDDAQVTAELRAHVARINAGLPAHQQIRRIVFTDQDFSVENGLRTKNMKLNRRSIRAAFLEDGAGRSS